MRICDNVLYLSSNEAEIKEGVHKDFYRVYSKDEAVSVTNYVYKKKYDITIAVDETNIEEVKELAEFHKKKLSFYDNDSSRFKSFTLIMESDVEKELNYPPQFSFTLIER